MPRPATGIRQRILIAARDAFDQRGVDATSLRTIAKAARTTLGMIYYYFATKDDLYFAVIEEVYAHVLESFAAALATDQDEPPTLRRSLEVLLRRLATLSADDRAVVRIVLREITVSTERRRRLLERFARGHIPLIVGAIQRARARGELRVDLHPAMIVFATGALSALSTLLIEHLPVPGLPRGEARIAATLELLFAGIAAPAAGGASKAAASRRPRAPRATRRARRTA